MVVDPIIRFNWIFYAIYAHDLQHSSLVSFFVAFTEVIRRGIWVLFRVENEHCSNVFNHRASRDIPLPYPINAESQENLLRKADEDNILDPQHGGVAPGSLDGHTSPDRASRANRTPLRPATTAEEHLSRHASRTTGTDLERGLAAANKTPSLRHRPRDTNTDSPITRALRRAGSTILSAHAQDYERKRKPGDLDEASEGEGSSDSDGDIPVALPKSSGKQRHDDERDSSEERDRIETQRALEAAGEGSG
jgi:hypothetical protein